MKLYSTNNKEHIVGLKEAVLKSLPPDNGLYMPVAIPKLESSFIDSIESYSFKEVAFEVASCLIGDYIPEGELKNIVNKAINFPAPVVMHDDNIGTLELFHGPSLAFKDFGARFMAELISYLIKDENRKITILVATSGDTGGAVAAGFYNTPGIEVVILYPKGKVSALQEKQLTTLGKNIHALEIEGTFDDCQALVKKAFLDEELNEVYDLSSANSINIARLIPQTFYYFEAYRQIKKYNRPSVFAVPSGNFGNLTAGLIAKKMGLPIDHFIAATNVNKIVPDYLKSGEYQPKPSIATISNAMDVGAPSNFVRMIELYNHDHSALTKDISGYYLTDDEDKEVIQHIHKNFDYIADPHGAIGYAAVKDYLVMHPEYLGVYLETAHPAKFLNVMEELLPFSVEPPKRLKDLASREKVADLLPPDFDRFKSWMIERDGFVRFHTLGGFDAKTLTAQRVIIHGREDVMGVMGTKPIHVLTPEERAKAPKTTDFFIDTGLSVDKVKELIRVGDTITRERALIEMGDCVNSKSLDNRVSVFILVETLKNLKGKTVPYDVYGVFTVQEEVGIRGAISASSGINPDFGIALDVTLAYDLPGSSSHEMISQLGHGTAIKVMDGSVISDYRMVNFLRELAEKENIKHQMEILTAGGTDTAGIQKYGKGGAIAGAISIPTRYLHQVIEMSNKEDIHNSILLLQAALSKLDKYDWSFR
ncbi:unnamed protein product [Cyprideis torosa]|uniref:Threonine synthase-like 2 n=1 Tax=Cyprideis torosa TaxID=163714 RepID=A0A7R8WGV6_9CRUS|nr:unnamed protein product [Cyprideis torosa]CAG0898665.1 unnamed protein product [Cyprideis torosa]